MTDKYEVRFALEVRASSPEQAATIARDMLLDLDTGLCADVHAYEYCKPADDWFPSEDCGVWFAFGDRRPDFIYGGEIEPYRGSGVQPVESCAWARAPLSEE
jgi:hypothetical protein